MGATWDFDVLLEDGKDEITIRNPDGYDQITVLNQWIEENGEGRYYGFMTSKVGVSCYVFEHRETAFAFKMRWG